MAAFPPVFRVICHLDMETDFTTMARQLTAEKPIAEERDIYRLGLPCLAASDWCDGPCGCSVWASATCASRPHNS